MGHDLSNACQRLALFMTYHIPSIHSEDPICFLFLLLVGGILEVSLPEDLLQCKPEQRISDITVSADSTNSFKIPNVF